MRLKIFKGKNHPIIANIAIINLNTKADVKFDLKFSRGPLCSFIFTFLISVKHWKSNITATMFKMFPAHGIIVKIVAIAFILVPKAWNSLLTSIIDIFNHLFIK